VESSQRERDRHQERAARVTLSSGLKIDRIIARAQQDDVKKKLIENTGNAVARGTFGSPTFFVGNEIYFGKDSLRDVEDEILAQTAAAQRKTA
jgi:2-hydroxychromene-2-carboxylate isomerase